MIKTNHFFISYAGNKRRECDTIYKEIKELLDGDEIETIIEPYCGSSAISYFIAHHYPKKFKYILNDNNEYLMKTYEIFKDEKQLDNFIEQLNETCKDLNKEKYMAIVKQNTHISWFIKNKIYSIRAGLWRLDYKFKDFIFLKNVPIINFLRSEDITFQCKDGIETLLNYKDDKRYLIILDPPYLELCNDFYKNSNTNIYEHCSNYPITEHTSKTIFILNDMWIIRLLFKDQIKVEYDKLYQPNKRKVKHLIIKNF
jgi:site-specific DNA-adenine methylase